MIDFGNIGDTHLCVYNIRHFIENPFDANCPWILKEFMMITDIRKLLIGLTSHNQTTLSQLVWVCFDIR
jgi:hypothetical protein